MLGLLKPIDSAEDVMDRGLTVIWPPGVESVLGIYKNSPSNITGTLAERTIVCKDDDECDKVLIPEAVKTGSSVFETGILWTEYFASAVF